MKTGIKFHRLSILWPLLYLWAISFNVHALGIGEANVLSSLGQSLRAEAPVFSSGQEDLTKLSVRLATEENFDRAGISFAHDLQQLSFSIQQKNNGSYIIEFTSSRPINDPIIDFLVEVTWPEGQLHRQYTLFVDPPLFDTSTIDKISETAPDFQAIAEEVAIPDVPPLVKTDTSLADDVVEPAPVEEEKIELFAAKPVPIEEPVIEAPVTSGEPVQESQPKTIIKPEAVETLPVEELTIIPEKPSPVLPAVEESVALSANEVEELMALEPDPVQPKSVKRMFSNLLKKAKRGRGNQLISPLGKTKSGDSLWKIANAARIDDSVTTQQVMLAIMEANPDAFNRNNVNTLKAGVKLKTPSAALVNSLTAYEAVQQMNEQNRDWNEYLDERRQKKQAVAEAKKQADQAAADQATAVDTKISGPRLKLVIPDATDQAISGEDQVVGENGSDALSEAGQSLSSSIGGGDAAVDSSAQEAAGTIDAETDVVDNIEKLNSEVLGLEQKETENPEQSLAIQSEELASFQGGVNDDGLLDSIQNIIMGSLMYWFLAVLFIVLIMSLIARRSAAKKLAASTGAANLFEASKPNIKDQVEVYQDISEEGLEPTLDITQLMNDVDALMLQESWKEAQSLLNDAMFKNPGQLNVRQKLIELHYKTSNKEAFIDQSKLFYMETGGGKGVNWENIAGMGRHIASDHQLFSDQERGEGASFVDWDNIEEIQKENDENDVVESKPEQEQDADTAKKPQEKAPDDLLDGFPGFIDDDNKASENDDKMNTLAINDQPTSSKEEKEQELIDQIEQDLENFSPGGSQSEVPEHDFGFIESSDENFRVDEDDDASEETVFELVDEDNSDSDSLEVDDLETKLDVARVYMDMGSKKEAKRLLKELLDDPKASAEQHEQASNMLSKVS